MVGPSVSARYRIASSHNVLFVSDDRAAEGLFPQMTVLDNLVATRLDASARVGVLSWPTLRRLGASLAERVGVDRRRLKSQSITLSGGNQQKLLFGRALASAEAGVLLMNEPTRGIDVGARAEIYRIMRELCDLGRGVDHDIVRPRGSRRDRRYRHHPLSRPRGRALRR